MNIQFQPSKDLREINDYDYGKMEAYFKPDKSFLGHEHSMLYGSTLINGKWIQKKWCTDLNCNFSRKERI